MRVCFRYLEKAAFSVYAASLFQILAGNMSAIAPTGNPRSKDYAAWKRAGTEGLNSTARRIILIYAGEPEHIVGYFQYSADKELFMMEEIQIAAPYQHKHAIFRRLYAYALENLEEEPAFVEACAHKNNLKSMGILKKMGLEEIGQNKNGTSFLFRGSFQSLLDWSHTR